MVKLVGAAYQGRGFSFVSLIGFYLLCFFDCVGSAA